MSIWTERVEIPFPRGEDGTEWWDGMTPRFQGRWATLLSRLDKRGREHFHNLRRGMRDEFQAPAGTPEREREEDAAEERLFTRVAEGVAKRLAAAEVRP